MKAEPLLVVEGLHSFYGLARILSDVSFSLAPGEAVALMGRNGAGKTTTLKSIMSLVPPKKGRILFRGENIAGLPPHVVARRGLSLVPEGRHIFPALSVLEHLRVPVPPPQADRDRLLKRAFDIFPELKEKKNQNGGSLSGGQQQMMVIARALMTKPQLLLLDEPMEGLAPITARKVSEALQLIRREGLTILFASTNLDRAMQIAERAYFLEKGEIVFEGGREELKSNLEVQRKYLGVRE
ncbi:MAG: ABC transporter ATP-binding protein [Thermodesulfobacteriota bacterium]